VIDRQMKKRAIPEKYVAIFKHAMGAREQ